MQIAPSFGKRFRACERRKSAPAESLTYFAIASSGRGWLGNASKAFVARDLGTLGIEAIWLSSQVALLILLSGKIVRSSIGLLNHRIKRLISPSSLAESRASVISS